MSPLSIPFSLAALRAASAGLRPPVAVALGAEGIAAGVAAPLQLATASLPQGALVPGLGESNLRSAAEIASALRGALGRLEPRGRAATLVVPDATVRVFLLDFDTLPARRDEILPILRFRLRKSVAFDVENAGISYQILSEGSTRLETPWKVLVALMPGPVREEYEALMRSVGLEPGVLLPQCLAALSPLESQQAELILCHSPASLTLTIVSGSDILLYRTSELPEGDAAAEEIQRSVAVACAFFEDTLRSAPGRILYSGALPLAEFARIVEEIFPVVEPLQSLTSIPAATGMADHLQGLATAAAGALAGAG